MRTISFVLSFLVAVSLFFSCKQKQEKYVIGISQCSDDDWRDKMNREMNREATLHQGIELIIRTVNDDTEKQIEDIQEFIDRKVDLLIVSPNEAAPVTPIVEKAYHTGIPVILVDRKILSDRYTAFIGADNYQIGKEVGTYVVNLLKGKGNVVEIKGLDGSSSAQERHQGFLSIINRHPGIRMAFQADGAWLKDIAAGKMEEALSDSLKIDLVFAHNDRMAMGAYNTAKRHRKTQDIYFLGIDALPGESGGIEQVLNHKLEATFIYPTGGDQIIQLALDILQGRKYEKNNLLYTAVVDKTNARILKLQSDEIIKQGDKIEFLNTRVGNYMSQYTTQRYLLYTAIAFVFLLICFFVALFTAYRSKNRLNIELARKNDAINKQKDMLERQRDQMILLSKQLEEATHSKLVFFTNISHEFRTPLTLISGPVSTLLAQEKISGEQRRLLSLVQKNVTILLKLVDQIVDFRKYENGKLKLLLSRNDLKQQFTEWNESFAEISKRRHIRFKFDVLSSDDFTWVYDSEKVERIYFNLLSNAVKFTPEKGEIDITLDKVVRDGSPFVVFTVTNYGKGISADDIRNIFDRFYQVDSRLAGSGIGLALVKAFVDLHGGEISVESDHDRFTTFTVTLPFNLTDNERQLSEPDGLSGRPEKLLARPETGRTEEEIFLENHSAKSKPTLLIVDDNPDIRVYIKTMLQDQYTVLEAKDGSEGIRKALKYVPDIIISDIMMPGTDGLELCTRLKEEILTSHIPIILLTACSLDEQRITGFEKGADDYISKPFNSNVLEVRVRKLIENRKKLKELFSENLFTDNHKEILAEPDKSFIARLRTTIEENIADSELNVEELGQNLGLSRTQLYRKVKSLTNYSPNEFVKIIRLKKARMLLSATELNVTEVAYSVGFTSPSYFAKCYKEYFNESPSDFQKQV